MEDSNATANWTKVSKEGDVILGKFQFILGVPIFLFNFVAVLVLYKGKKLKFNIRIPALQMAISDMCLGLVLCLPNTFFDVSTVLCISKRYVIMAFYLVEALTITVMNGDRFLSLQFPFHYSNIVVRSRMLLICVFFWPISVLLPILERNCAQTVAIADREPLQWSLIVFFGLVFINLLEYGFVVKFILKSFTSVKFEGNRKCVLKVTLFTGCFVVCTTPVLLLNTICAISAEPNCAFLSRMKSVLNVLPLVNSFVNPVLYFFLFTECRFQLVNLFCFWNRSLLEKNKVKRNDFYCAYQIHVITSKTSSTDGNLFKGNGSPCGGDKA